MVVQCAIRMLVAAAAVCTVPALASAQLKDIDEALSLSRKTGRPIFAMAGNKT